MITECLFILCFALTAHVTICYENSAEITNKEDLNDPQGTDNASLSSLNDVTSANITTVQTNCTYKYSCIQNETDILSSVQLGNASMLSSLLLSDPIVTSGHNTARCMVVLFYSRSCPFSAQAAPHFNALPRAFPNMRLFALNAHSYPEFNAQLGIVGVPTILLFHNGRPAARFNETTDYSLEAFARFITKYTGIVPETGKLFVTSADFGGPVPSVPVKVRDYFLIASWTFIVICLLYLFYLSRWYEWLVDAALNAWREAEAQHPHND